MPGNGAGLVHRVKRRKLVGDRCLPGRSFAHSSAFGKPVWDNEDMLGGARSIRAIAPLVAGRGFSPSAGANLLIIVVVRCPRVSGAHGVLLCIHVLTFFIQGADVATVVVVEREDASSFLIQ